MSTILELFPETSEVIGCTLEEISPHTHYLFTGKGLAADKLYHLGHFCLFRKLAILSAIYDTVFQLSDLQKTLPSDGQLALTDLAEYTENFLAFVGFDSANTYFFKDSENFEMLSVLANMIATKIKRGHLKIFPNVQTLYDLMYYAYQLAPLCLSKTLKKVPVIITAKDQKGPFLLARDIAPKIGLVQPIIVVVEGLPDLLMKDKMSSSNPRLTVQYTRDRQWNFKVIKKALSGTTPLNCFARALVCELAPIYENIRVLDKAADHSKDLFKKTLIHQLSSSIKPLCEGKIHWQKLNLTLGIDLKDPWKSSTQYVK